jgi:hypothetical protein
MPASLWSTKIGGIWLQHHLSPAVRSVGEPQKSIYNLAPGDGIPPAVCCQPLVRPADDAYVFLGQESVGVRVRRITVAAFAAQV